jgi:hypothetical protein
MFLVESATLAVALSFCGYTYLSLQCWTTLEREGGLCPIHASQYFCHASNSSLWYGGLEAD